MVVTPGVMPVMVSHCPTDESKKQSASSTPYLNNASKVLQARVDCSSPERDEQLIQVATTLCPFLANNADDTTTVKELTGGLSNALFLVCTTGHSVLVRIHSAQEEELAVGIVNREEENRILAWLSRENKAPVFYGRFLNGRVEEFYDGYVTLSFDQMYLYAPQIANHMAALHSMEVPPEVLAPTSLGHVWTRVEAWFQLAQDLVPSPNAAANHSSIELSFLHSEWKWLQEQLTQEDDDPVIRFCRQVVFAHMDCQSLNILKNDNGNVKIIDLEYAGLHPRAADIANTFCEYCNMNNLKADYVKEYPSIEQQNEFLQAYLQRADSTLDSNQETLSTMRHEVGKHTLISHLGWAVWSIVQSRLSDIEFDYIAYAQERMDGYQLFKTIYFDPNTTDLANSTI